MQSETKVKKWGSTNDAAEHLDCSESSLNKELVNGLLGIPFHRLGRHVKYNFDELDQWLFSQKGK
jgi:excisionase family DNA binding protein